MITGADGGVAAAFPSEEDLRRGIEAMFFAYRGFTAAPDRILAECGYGRAHHRALHFIKRVPGTSVGNLIAILGVSKQSLNRVLRALIVDGLVESRVGGVDRRERHLYLAPAGVVLAGQLAEAQTGWMRAAYEAAGPEAVAGFRQLLEALMDPCLRAQFARLEEPRA